eukprot:CAMPEP_0172595690 /NCGR_PEP_ID=MMETSP1068-20121228/15307_1 /TAXON_ID=35684 /ORGANISM="Pseudopedinella elastica, Strain CCMP716" /LENGTH=77 /DNA_ID=CAMNT_0013394331 /DNA_START=71 /DNA_END=300 /DNA_ORIENTATION=-
MAFRFQDVSELTQESTGGWEDAVDFLPQNMDNFDGLGLYNFIQDENDERLQDPSNGEADQADGGSGGFFSLSTVHSS